MVQPTMYPNGRWIGIDLGTSNTCVSYWSINHDGIGKAEVIQNQEGKYTTPSVVAFKDVETELIGDAAVNHAVMKPQQFIYDAKRLIGKKKFADHPEIAEYIKNWPFKVMEDASD